MTPQEKLRFFWTIGTLPGTMFDDFDDTERRIHPVATPRRRRINWLKCISLGLLG